MNAALAAQYRTDMQNITITIDKSQVWHEVAKATNYTGAKMMSGDDPGAYDRIFATDEDREMMERFWVEACSIATNTLKPWLSDVGDQPIHHGVDISTNYVVELSLSERYDPNLNDSVQASLFSFIVAAILSKWYRLTNKGETEVYAAEAAAQLQNVEEKICYRRKPVRVSPI